jgi:hypothetical protein
MIFSDRSSYFDTFTIMIIKHSRILEHLFHSVALIVFCSNSKSRPAIFIPFLAEMLIIVLSFSR